VNADPLKPGSFTVRDSQQRAAQLLQAGETLRAYEILLAVLPLDRRDTTTLGMLGDAAVRLSRLTEGARHLELALKLRPNNPGVVGLLANTYSSLGETGKAHRTIDAFLKNAPATPAIVALKARLFQSRGDNERAHDLIAPLLESDDQSASITGIYGSICLALKRRPEGIDAVRKALERVDLVPDGRRLLLFSLGHLLDGEGAYDEAFDNFQRGNAMLDDVEPTPNDKFREHWSDEYLDSIDIEPNESQLAVMIVGMPRSGTTLTEQVIASHPSARGVGESDLLPLLARAAAVGAEDKLDGPRMRQMADGYVAGLNAAVSGDPDRVVDKLPGNYMFLGTIAKALPNTAVIHCQRDARDTCLSCYFQDFGHRQPFTRRLDTVAKQFLSYRSIMAHWHDVLDIEILDSRYEDLTADPRPNVERLIERCGLDWNEACMSPHKAKSTVTTASIGQVRQPIYKTSQERWRRYEKHIGPMLELLEGV